MSLSPCGAKNCTLDPIKKARHIIAGGDHSSGSFGKYSRRSNSTPRKHTVNGCLTIPEASLLCKRPYISMYSLATAGKLGPVQKHGRTYVLTVKGVEAYLEAQRAKEHARARKSVAK